jgi:hypothetical protein
MPELSRFLTIISLLANLLVFSFESRAATSADLELKEGDFWKYQHVDLWTGNVTGTSTRTVRKAGVEGGVAVVVDIAREKYDEEIQRDGSIVRPMPPVPIGKGTFAYSYLKFPLSRGNEWKTTSFRFWALSAVMVRIDWKCKVEDEERVSTPAGQFDTIRVQCNGWWHDRGWSGPEDQTLWYAPATRWIVKNRYVERKSGGGVFSQWESILLQFDPGK